MLLLLILPSFIAIFGVRMVMNAPADDFQQLCVEFMIIPALSLLAYWGLAEIRDFPSLRQCFSGISRHAVGVCVGLVLLFQAACVAVAELFLLTGVDIDHLPNDSLMPADLTGLAFAVPAVVLLMPLWEELFFRGLLFGRLNRSLPTPIAIGVSSLIFTLMHDNHYAAGWASLLPFLERFAVGAIAALLYLRYKSLTASYLFHACANLIAVTAGAVLS